MSRSRPGELPSDWPEARLREDLDLPAKVAERPELVGWLAQHVHTVLHWSENEATQEWEEPRARDLKTVAGAVRELERVLDRLPPSLTINALMHAGGMTPAEFRTALYCLRDEAEHWLSHRGVRRPGRKGDSRRLHLEAVVAGAVHRAGVRLTTYPDGVLARTLIACYRAAGLRVPAKASLKPRLKRLRDSWR
jgi:hypothetical protein